MERLSGSAPLLLLLNPILQKREEQTQCQNEKSASIECKMAWRAWKIIARA
jgi:hypothetical protein